MKTKISSVLLALVLAPNLFGQSKLNNQVDSVSYLIGQTIATNVMRDLSEANKALVIEGLRDGLNNTDPLCADPGNTILSAYFQEKSQLKAQQAEKENQLTKLAGEKWLEQNKSNKDVQVTESGLQYIILEKGTGPKPNATSKVKVHYHGTTPDDVVFDSSVDRGEPITFGLNQVIKGWTEGVQLMPVGSKFKFFIPQELAYGSTYKSESIQPFTALVFDIELVEIVKTK